MSLRGPPSHAFFDNKGVFTTLDPPGTIHSQGGFINSQGQVVGEYRADKARGFIWRNGTFTTLNLNFPGDLPTVPFGINDRGAVVGTYLTAGNINHGFLRSSNGDFKTIDVPGAVVTVAEGINNAGTIVGVYVTPDKKLHGFVWNNGVFTMPVDVRDAQNTEINSINAQGEIVGFYDKPSGVEHGFLGIPVR
jgi:probable HAF family extracellular repeat protein